MLVESDSVLRHLLRRRGSDSSTLLPSSCLVFCTGGAEISKRTLWCKTTKRSGPEGAMQPRSGGTGGFVKPYRSLLAARLPPTSSIFCLIWRCV